MSEAVFPVLGAALVFGVVLPAAAILTKLTLAMLGRLVSGTELHTYHCLRYVLLVGSSAAPLVWFLSASLHQAETGRSASVCAIDHAAEAFCPEAGFFALALSLCAAIFAWPPFLKTQPVLDGASSRRVALVTTRLAGLMGRRQTLRPLRARIAVGENLSTPIGTVGILRPRVILDAAFVDRLDDDALEGALLHEFEHVRGYDPLRYLVACWAMAVNPFGRMFLRNELSRWLLAREIQCDREAVLNGASATGLAQAIVTAARPVPATPTAALGEVDAVALKLRVSLLLAYSERVPVRYSLRPALRLALCAIAFVALLPHRGGTDALDAVHVLTESAIALLTES